MLENVYYIFHILIQQKKNIGPCINHFISHQYLEIDYGQMGAVMSMALHEAPLFTHFSSSTWAHLARVLIYANTQALLVFSHEPLPEYESPLNHKIFFCK